MRSGILMAGFFHKFSNFLTVDSGGWRAVLGALLRSAILAAALAFSKSIGHQPDGQWTFDYQFFFASVGVIACVNLLSNLLDIGLRGGSLLSPTNGRMFRQERKKATAGLIRRIGANLDGQTVSNKEAQKIISTILDCIALHVRDARGSHNKDRIEVFASLLIDDGQDVVVVVRDNLLHSDKYRRPVPQKYPKGGMLATRALTAKRVLSVGDLCTEYPEAPTNKPYRSILAIPIFGTDESPLAVVSVDSSRAYFFQSFQRDKAENDLENGLLPYLELLVLALENLVDRDPSSRIKKLVEGANERGGNSAGIVNGN